MHVSGGARVLAKVAGIATAILLVVALFGIGLFYYAFSIPEPEGRSLARWPSTFIENFSEWIIADGAEVGVTEIGLSRLDEYGLWLQVIDGSGREVLEHGKPSDVPSSYNAAEIAALQSSPFDGRYTKFVGLAPRAMPNGCYIIGFPYSVGKGIIFYNGTAIDRMYSVAVIACVALTGMLLVGLAAYGIWMGRKLRIVTDGIEGIETRRYRQAKEKGAFRSVIAALNRLDSTIEASEAAKRETENMRNEWIENITHDIRTPLSPIKGYAEMLAEDGGCNQIDSREGSQIILRNAKRIESLVDDLKLAYQLDGNKLPLSPSKVPLERIAKECVIDIVNSDARYTEIVTFSQSASAIVEVDCALLARTFSNIAMNAILHNPEGTHVAVCVCEERPGWIAVKISDDGSGIPQEDLERLFDRYWRGSRTESGHEGSGLGLAIANEAIALMGGAIRVESREGEGTIFTVELPASAQD